MAARFAGKQHPHAGERAVGRDAAVADLTGAKLPPVKAAGLPALLPVVAGEPAEVVEDEAHAGDPLTGGRPAGRPRSAGDLDDAVGWRAGQLAERARRRGRDRRGGLQRPGDEPAVEPQPRLGHGVLMTTASAGGDAGGLSGRLRKSVGG
jgi:hypothetical protein